jgi:hypothetical protein
VADRAPEGFTFLRIVRITLLLVVAVDVVVVALTVALDRSFTLMPGAVRSTIGVTGALAGYAALIAWLAQSGREQAMRRALAASTWPGTVGGVLLAFHLALENFGTRAGEDGRVTLAFMGATFLVWGIAGYRAARSTGRAGLGALCGGWAGVVSASVSVTCGWLLMLAGIPSAAYVATWAEFALSGSSDPRAFAIANALDSGASQMLEAIVIGVICGSLGAAAARLRRS